MDNSRRNLSLNALGQGSQGTVVSINCSGPVRRRLMDMGLTHGNPGHRRWNCAFRGSHYNLCTGMPSST